MEAGLWRAKAVNRWLTSPHRHRCFRVLLELPGGLDRAGTETEADRLLGIVRRGDGDAAPVLVHGKGSSCWPALRHAGRRGLATRIGLEDVLEMPDGSSAPSNVALVAAAHTLLRTSP